MNVKAESPKPGTLQAQVRPGPPVHPPPSLRPHIHAGPKAAARDKGCQMGHLLNSDLVFLLTLFVFLSRTVLI